MLNAIRPEKESKGIKIEKEEKKITPFVDLFLDPWKTRSITKILQKWDESAGSKVNMHKSIAFLYTSKDPIWKA